MSRKFATHVPVAAFAVAVFASALLVYPAMASADTLSDLYGAVFDRISVLEAGDDSFSGELMPYVEDEISASGSETDDADGVDGDAISTYSAPTARSLSPREVSSEMLYFCKWESGQNYDQGLSSGDGYHAMGYFQFDNRYDLGSFLYSVYMYNPTKYSALKILGDKYAWELNRDTRSGDSFTQFGNDLNAAWHACYQAAPEEFSELQNDWAYTQYYDGSDGIRGSLSAMGISIDNRSDCVKSLVWGMANLFGKGGGKYEIANGNYWGANWFIKNSGVSDSMDDETFVATLCDYIVNNVARRYPSQSQYHQGWQNRYRDEKSHYVSVISENAGVAIRYSTSEFASNHADDLPDGTYRFAPIARDGASLEVANASSSLGAAIQISSQSDTDSQSWRLTHDSNGFIKLSCVETGKVIECTSGNSSKGTKLQQWIDNGSMAQKWIAARQTDGSLILVSALSSYVGVDDSGDVVKAMVAELSGGNTSNSTRIQIWDSNGSVAQRWKESSALTDRDRLDELAQENLDVVPDGTYAIASPSAGRGVAEVASGSVSAGANVRLWLSNATPAQRWIVSHDSTGYITIINAKSGMALDVCGGNAAAGANVWQTVPNGTWAQKWIAVPREDGGVELRSALKSGLTIERAGGGTSWGTNLQLWIFNGTVAQSFSFVNANPDVPEDSDSIDEDSRYVLSPLSSPELAVEVAGGSASNGADVRGWTANGTLSQTWAFVRVGGYYRLVNANSDKCLEIADGDVVQGANAQQWEERGNSDSQLFRVKKLDNGAVTLVNVASGLALGVSNGELVGVTVDSDLAEQQFDLKDAATSLPSGTYRLTPKTSSSLALEVSGGSLKSGSGIQQWLSNNTRAQRWYLGTAGNGKYFLENVNSMMRLSTDENGSVSQVTVDESDASQLWAVKVVSGGYKLCNAEYPNLYLSVSDGSASYGAKVVAASWRNDNSQVFSLDPASVTPDAGTYHIQVASAHLTVLEASGGSLDNGASVQGWLNNGTDGQKWRLTKNSDGTFTIVNCPSDKVIEISGGNAFDGAGIQLWQSNGSKAQRWKVEYRAGGYAFVSVLDPSLVLTLSSGVSLGSRVCVEPDSADPSQRFMLERTSYVPVYRGWQNPSWMYQVSNNTVSFSHSGSGQFGYVTPSRIPIDATRSQCVEAMISRAYEYLGTPYRWDYACNVGVGVDCSGLVLQCLYATGMDLSPFNPWDHYYTPGHDQYANDLWNSGRFKHVAWSDRQRGDLISWKGHIAIYLGNDQMIEATSPRVRIASVYVWGSNIRGVIRPFA